MGWGQRNSKEKRTLDEDVVVANLRDRCRFVELEVVEAALALDGPLLLSSRCHCAVCIFQFLGKSVLLWWTEIAGRFCSEDKVGTYTRR